LDAKVEMLRERERISARTRLGFLLTPSTLETSAVQEITARAHCILSQI